MIKEIQGDLLACGADIICHQVNFEGIMGGGVALSIRNKLLLENGLYQQYQTYCAVFQEAAIGTVQMLETPEVIVANLFCQHAFNSKKGVEKGLTDYEAMEKCLRTVKLYALKRRSSKVAVPGYMGCGIAGGDWTRVLRILKKVFEDSAVELTIVYWDQNAKEEVTE